MKLKTIVLLTPLVLIAAAVVTYRTVPTHNTDLTHFDAIVVLGKPANRNGTPSSGERWRMNEGVREYHRGVAPIIIPSGGAAYNQYQESHVMSAYAQSLGVPASAIVVEDRSVDTLQNIAYVEQIMDAHGWHSIELVSSGDQLPRAALMLQPHHLLWSTHVAPTPGINRVELLNDYASEIVATTIDRWFGLEMQPFIHRMKMHLPMYRKYPGGNVPD